MILVYMAALAALGVANIMKAPDIMVALSPTWAVKFFAINPKLAFLALGSVFLAVTGAETLYADMAISAARPSASPGSDWSIHASC